jgi:hypothetical protein
MPSDTIMGMTVNRPKALRLPISILPPLAWAILDPSLFPLRFLENEDFGTLANLEFRPVPISERYGIDLSSRTAIAVRDIRTGEVIARADFDTPHDDAWWANAHARHELGIIVGDARKHLSAKNAQSGMRRMADDGALAARLQLAVKGFEDGVGTRPVD